MTTATASMEMVAGRQDVAIMALPFGHGRDDGGQVRCHGPTFAPGAT